jgi:hypothetical protein
MPEIAIGRKEITSLMRCSWRTIQRNKRADKGFRDLFRENPLNTKPFILIREYHEWLIEWNNIKKAHKK